MDEQSDLDKILVALHQIQQANQALQKENLNIRNELNQLQAGEL
ncbi:17771_t:CDS:1, partial [Cetraspora pellucida]